DGCSESELDEDNDGVFNNLDKCLNTLAGETVNSDGCSESELDEDNDGVSNKLDKCLNTINGSIVDSNGCAQYQLVDIQPTDIKVIVNSSTCPGKNNGIVGISFVKDYSYNVTLTGGGESRSFENVNYNLGLDISNLSVGIYEVCVKISESDSFKQCYNVVIEAPKALKVSKASLQNKEITYHVSGSKYYLVIVNNKEYEYSFNNTNEQEIKVNLGNGNNFVEIKTNKVCQGAYSKNINENISITMYPVPVKEVLTIIVVNESNVTVTVRNLTGNIILSKNINVVNGIGYLPMNRISAGVYIISITTSTQIINTKILKQ
ncbi:T9SS type A sorting domain-containing protein, partial [uncultured Tenacibaculum sp.]|uniref:T9SS type A sorting domain-containing protein n=1 Tax=uncultured Tenacibaculum sp. TaxID=174713 RepID=UPI0026396FAE